MKSIYVIHTLDGCPYIMSGIRSAWVRACRRASVKNATIKDLRPKALTDAERAGYNIGELKTAAAHVSVTTTEGYLTRFSGSTSTAQLREQSASCNSHLTSMIVAWRNDRACRIGMPGSARRRVARSRKERMQHGHLARPQR